MKTVIRGSKKVVRCVKYDKVVSANKDILLCQQLVGQHAVSTIR
jgi:hypothetical protein